MRNDRKLFMKKKKKKKKHGHVVITFPRPALYNVTNADSRTAGRREFWRPPNLQNFDGKLKECGRV